MKMKVHAALAELKVIKKRIDDLLETFKICDTKVASASKTINGITVVDFLAKAQGDYDTLVALCNRQAKIRTAINESNSVNTITVNGEEMTITAALIKKDLYYTYMSSVMKKVANQYNSSVSRISSDAVQLELKAEAFIQNLYGRAESKATSDEVLKAREDYKKNNSTEIVSPFYIPDRVGNFNAEVDKFMSDIDSQLSIANALNEIEIDD